MTVTSTTSFRYYKGAGWGGVVSCLKKSLGADTPGDVSRAIIRRVSFYKSAGYAVTKRKFGKIKLV